MASKMISIREELYEKLAKLKHGDESFSDVIEHLLANFNKNPLKHFGIGKDLAEEDLNGFENFLEQNRKISRDQQKLISL